MHLSPEFTQDSALAAAVGGMGIGAVATIFAQTNQRLLPSATPDAEVWTGMVAGAFALVSNPFFALVDDASAQILSVCLAPLRIRCCVSRMRSSMYASRSRCSGASHVASRASG